MHRPFYNRIVSRRLASVYRIDFRNVGDLVSTPVHYFPYLSRANQLDLFAETAKPSKRLAGLVLGGGGCIGFPAWAPLLDAYAASAIKAKIIWGAGQNVHDSSTITFPKSLEKFHLVGLRDYPNPWRWTPCPSCLHPAFDRNYEVKHPFVFFEQSLFSPIDSGKHPKMSNTVTDFERIIAFLGSGETVFSSSYHGVYWATLLGRKAVAVRPFSSKFSRLRFPVPILETNDWNGAARDAVAYPEALSICRDANVAFSRDVWTLLTEAGAFNGAADHMPAFNLCQPKAPRPKSQVRTFPGRVVRKVKRVIQEPFAKRS